MPKSKRQWQPADAEVRPNDEPKTEETKAPAKQEAPKSTPKKRNLSAERLYGDVYTRQLSHAVGYERRDATDEERKAADEAAKQRVAEVFGE